MSHLIEKIDKADTPLKDYGVHTIRRLLESGKTPNEIAWQIIPTSCASVSNQAQVVCNLF